MLFILAAFNQEKALVGAFSVLTNLRMELFQALTGAHAVFGYIARFPSQDYQEVLYNANIFALHTLCVDRMQVENLI